MKYIKIVFIFLLIHLLCFSTSYCDDIQEEVMSSIEEDIPTSTNPEEEPEIYSRRAIVFERNSKTIIYEKNIDEKCAMASTTKIMTSILVIENCNLSDTVTVSAKAASTGGSRLGLKTGDKITVHDLLYGLMLVSGNDSAVALAEYLGNSVEGFAEMMNEKSISLGLTSTHFVTPHGLDDDEHYTTAYELAILTDYALNNETFCKIVGTHSTAITINGSAKNLSNTNELLGHYNGVYGVKTGFTGNAGRCLVTATKRPSDSDLDIITIVLGADTKKIRTSDSMKLIDYAFHNFAIVDLKSKIEEKYEFWENYIKPNITIYKSNSEFCTSLSDIEHNFLAIKKTDIDNISISVQSVDFLEAPIPSNFSIGKISVYIHNDFIFDVSIVTNNIIEKKDALFYFKDFISNYKLLITS